MSNDPGIGPDLPVELVSERLVLRPVRIEYAPEIFADFTDEVTRYMFPGTPKSIEDTKEFLREAMRKNAAGTDFFASIFDKQTGEFLGGCGIHHMNTRTPEFGIWIKVAAHGHKYGLEAVRTLKKWAESALNFDYLSYPAVKANVPSRKIPEALGGVFERSYMFKDQDENNRELVEYRIYKS